MIGIYRRERTTSQPVELSLDIALPSTQVFSSHKVADTIDYAVVTRRLSEELSRQRFGLVEELAERVANILISEFASPWVRVSVAKIGILKEAAQVGVVIERRSPA
jgi:7,8-dihydroneopterin aldolase/epimerase/oxygenase